MLKTFAICIILNVLLSFNAAGGQIPPARTAAVRPNIVIIMADDLDSRQLSCYGGQNLKTTHIDALAKDGLKFQNLFT